jgi:hypothetical protein
MGQKSRNKKNKSLSPTISRVQSSTIESSNVIQRQKASILTPSSNPMPSGYKSSMNSSQKAAIFNNMDYVRGDIVRILLLLMIMALVLASLAILNVKSSILTNAGQHFSTFMHLQ